MVFRPCTADQINCASPPTAQNWAIGCTSKKKPSFDSGYFDLLDRPVAPESLYRAQLRDRLGPAAVAAIAKNPAKP